MDAEAILEKAGIRPTSNRILVLNALLHSRDPKSLIELETELATLERSSIQRVLTLLASHDVVHLMEDGRGVTNYEVCHSESHCSIDDMHPHFYCEKCRKVYCFEHISTPRIEIPDNFRIKSVNYMLKGVCPSCGGDGE